MNDSDISTGKELDAEQILAKGAEAQNEPLFVMLYTPLCGTCKLALRMLEVAEAAEQSLTVYRCNLNTAPALAQRWRIGSVPCLVRIQRGALDTLYRMESVETILRWLRQRSIHLVERRERYD